MLTSPTVGFVRTWQEEFKRWTYTLTTLLGDWLNQAERQFGTRDRSWTILGIEVGGPRPGVWFPQYSQESRCVVIYLSDTCQSNEEQARFELSQEIVHLLTPNGGGAALNIEEGIATLFANLVGPRHVNAPSYVKVLGYVEELLKIDPEAIIKLRANSDRFQDFTPEFIQKRVTGVSDQLASDLCTPYRD